MTAALRNWGGIGPGSNDADLALAAADGDRRAFAEIYDRYADRLHDFAIGMLRDRDSAADCVQDAFCIASTTLSGLREPDKLRPWLYAIVRNEAHKRLRQLRRERPSDEMPDVVSHDAGPDTLAHRMELANLISEAAGGLSDRDQAVLELAYRQGLDGPELAMALGVSQTNANTMVGRLRETIERSLGALLVARRIQSNPSSCPELAAVLHGWDGKFNILMRKRIARHIESCGACEDLRSRSVSPAALLGAPVFIPAPAWLKNSVQRDFELTSASHDMGNPSQGASTGGQSNFHAANTAPRPAIQSPADLPQESPAAYEQPAALVGGPTDDGSKRRVVPFMALLIAIPLAILGGTLAWVYLPSTALSPSGVVQDAPSPSPTPTVPAPTPAAVLPTAQPPKATAAPRPLRTPRPAAPLPTPQAKIPTPQPQAPIPTPQAPAPAPPAVQAPAPQIPQLPIGSLPGLIPGVPPVAQNPAQLPAQLPAQIPAKPPAQKQAQVPAQPPAQVPAQVPDPVGPAPKQVPDPVGPAPKQVPDPVGPAPQQVPDPVGPAPKQVPAPAPEPAPAPAPSGNCTPGDICVK
jgi:RNA polymerase sigma factor (sigma-70 family)